MTSRTISGLIRWRSSCLRSLQHTPRKPLCFSHFFVVVADGDSKACRSASSSSSEEAPATAVEAVEDMVPY